MTEILVEPGTSNYFSQLTSISDCSTLTQINDKVRGAFDEAEKIPLYHKHEGYVQKTTSHFGYFGEHMGLRNKVSLKPYGVCKPGYELIQNTEAFKPLEDIVKAGDGLFDKCGIWNNGASVYITVCNAEANINQHMKDKTPDYVKNNLFGLNDLGGNWALNFGNHAIRLFCLNQLPSINSWLNNRVRFKHTKSARENLNLVTRLMDGSLDSFSKSLVVYDRLANNKMSNDEFWTFSERLLNKIYGLGITNEDDPISYTPSRIKHLCNLEHLFNHHTHGAGKTKWGALQAVTAWRDHKQSNNYFSNIRGISNRIKEVAFDTLLDNRPDSYIAA
jgi:hypothetical protein